MRRTATRREDDGDRSDCSEEDEAHGDEEEDDDDRSDSKEGDDDKPHYLGSAKERARYRHHFRRSSNWRLRRRMKASSIGITTFYDFNVMVDSEIDPA